ncbi:hypothetical protein GVAV_001098 [Gurleya vavrai]
MDTSMHKNDSKNTNEKLNHNVQKSIVKKENKNEQKEYKKNTCYKFNNDELKKIELFFANDEQNNKIKNKDIAGNKLNMKDSFSLENVDIKQKEFEQNKVSESYDCEINSEIPIDTTNVNEMQIDSKINNLNEIKNEKKFSNLSINDQSEIKKNCINKNNKEMEENLKIDYTSAKDNSKEEKHVCVCQKETYLDKSKEKRFIRRATHPTSNKFLFETNIKIPKKSDKEDKKHEEYSPDKRYARYNTILGHGSSKVVYKGFDLHNNIEIAWNVVLEDLNGILEEINILKTINHPKILRYCDYWVEENRLIIITELMINGTLKDFIVEKETNIKQVKEWGRQILEAIKHLHDQQLVHRDIKCENIFIELDTNKIKLGDLGITKKCSLRRYSFVGTPEFMAREVFEGDGYGEAVDVYGFGMVLLEIITREYPYSECNHPSEVFTRVVGGVLPLGILKVKNACLRKIILSCIAPENDRISIKELQKNHFFTNDFHDSVLSEAYKKRKNGENVFLKLPVSGNKNFDISNLSNLPTSGCRKCREFFENYSFMNFKSLNEDSLIFVTADKENIGLQLYIAEDDKFIKFNFNVKQDTINSIINEMIADNVLEGKTNEWIHDFMYRGLVELKENLKSRDGLSYAVKNWIKSDPNYSVKDGKVKFKLCETCFNDVVKCIHCDVECVNCKEKRCDGLEIKNSNNVFNKNIMEIEKQINDLTVDNNVNACKCSICEQKKLLVLELGFYKQRLIDSKKELFLTTKNLSNLKQMNFFKNDIDFKKYRGNLLQRIQRSVNTEIENKNDELYLIQNKCPENCKDKLNELQKSNSMKIANSINNKEFGISEKSIQTEDLIKKNSCCQQNTLITGKNSNTSQSTIKRNEIYINDNKCEANKFSDKIYDNTTNIQNIKEPKIDCAHVFDENFNLIQATQSNATIKNQLSSENINLLLNSKTLEDLKIQKCCLNNNICKNFKAETMSVLESNSSSNTAEKTCLMSNQSISDSKILINTDQKNDVCNDAINSLSNKCIENVNCNHNIINIQNEISFSEFDFSKKNFKDDLSIEDFVKETAALTKRDSETAVGWIKILKNNEIEKILDLKILVEEDWSRLNLTVFASRAMKNMIYGKDKNPLREKDLNTNTHMIIDDTTSIKDFIYNLCTLIGRELQIEWINKILRQDIRTIGELKSLIDNDWERLELSVFAYRLIRNVVYKKGNIVSNMT